MAASALALYNKCVTKPMGKKIFSKLLCMKAPYFGSIKPLFEELRPGYCEVSLKKRRAVTNHIGTVHAIAMCNACELAGGVMTDVSIPKNMRWIPKGMTVRYLQKAETDLRAVAKIPSEHTWSDVGHDFVTTVDVIDTNDQVVMQADITMWVSPKEKKTSAQKS